MRILKRPKIIFCVLLLFVLLESSILLNNSPYAVYSSNKDDSPRREVLDKLKQ